MLILLLVVGIVVVIVGKVLYEKTTMFEDFGECTMAIGAVITILSLALIIGFLFDMSFSLKVDDKIKMYQEENENIESQIGQLVTNYMEYESDTYANFKSEDSITLVSMYPELKSDTLVNTQIEIYNENNKKIKKLKEELIDLSAKKWILYFGE